MKWKQNITNRSLSLVFLSVNFETHPCSSHLRRLLTYPSWAPSQTRWSKSSGIKHFIGMPGYFYTHCEEESLESLKGWLIKVSETDSQTTCLIIWNHCYTKVYIQNMINPSQLKRWHLIIKIWVIQWRVYNLIGMGT